MNNIRPWYEDTAECGHEVNIAPWQICQHPKCLKRVTCDDCAKQNRCEGCTETFCAEHLTDTVDGPTCAACLRLMAEDGREERVAA